MHNPIQVGVEGAQEIIDKCEGPKIWECVHFPFFQVLEFVKENTQTK